MLHARKQQLENELRVRMLRIRDAELTLLVRNSRALSVQSAMLSGVAFEGLLYTKMHGFTSEKASTVTKFLYPVMLAALLGCSLLAVFQFNLIVMMGPGLALRGPDGSMRVAVEACSIEYRTACFFLFLAVTIFHITLVLFAWGDIEREPYAKWMITFGAIGSFILLRAEARKIYHAFWVEPSESVTGAFFEQKNDGELKFKGGRSRAYSRTLPYDSRTPPVESRTPPYDSRTPPDESRTPYDESRTPPEEEEEELSGKGRLSRRSVPALSVSLIHSIFAKCDESGRRGGGAHPSGRGGSTNPGARANADVTPSALLLLPPAGHSSSNSGSNSRSGSAAVSACQSPTDTGATPSPAGSFQSPADSPDLSFQPAKFDAVDELKLPLRVGWGGGIGSRRGSEGGERSGRRGSGACAPTASAASAATAATVAAALLLKANSLGTAAGASSAGGARKPGALAASVRRLVTDSAALLSGSTSAAYRHQQLS
mmetsp:Transcript_19070/g.47598  ORF Transcript_19070/g.47598 Transcript_19070/m.47598 type:complete len:486 (+) Transcript_19070:51-1508(+)